jgi:hypothetical protein
MLPKSRKFSVPVPGEQIGNLLEARQAILNL